MKNFKQENYNSVSPYLIVDNAQNLVEQLKAIFGAKELRRSDHENGKIAHIELLLDDTVIMLSNSTEKYPANKAMLHFYVPDVFATFDKAIESGWEIIERPVSKHDDPDTRGSLYDCAGNYWAISTQQSII